MDKFQDDDMNNKLEIQLRNLKLTDNSKLLEHIFAVKKLCAKLDPSMTDGKIIFNILSGLPSSISETLTLLPKKTLSEFDASVKTFISRNNLLQLLKPSVPTPSDSLAQDKILFMNARSEKPQKQNFYKKKFNKNKDKDFKTEKSPSSDDNHKSAPSKDAHHADATTCQICAGPHAKLDCKMLVCRYCKRAGHVIFECRDPGCKVSKYNKNFQ